jgi:drug/metabolite transporter (DMT)-like permease
MFKFKMNIALFCLLACFWSGSFIGIKAVVTAWPPMLGAAIRVGIALFCFIIFKLLYKKTTTIAFNTRWKIWVIGLFSQAIPFSFLFWGENSISPGLAGILNATTPIWTFLLSLIFLPQFNFYSLRKLLGLSIAFIGIIVIFYPIIHFDSSYNILYGAGAVLVMAISYAIAGLLNQSYLSGANKIDFFTNIYHQHWASTTFLFLISLGANEWSHTSLLFTSSAPWFASFYLGICSTAIAYLIFYHLIREWDALRASTVLYIVPILTLLWDYLFYGNKPPSSEFVGVFIILFGVMLIQLTRFRRPTHAAILVKS